MLLAIWDDGVWQDAARLAAFVAGAYLFVLWIAALFWTYRDIASRTRDQFMQAMAVLLVLVFNIAGLFVYLIIRPKETLADRYDRQLEAEALLHEIHEQATCPSCRRKIADDFVVCPFCRTALRSACESCARPLNMTWVICPYCGADRNLPRPGRPELAAVAMPTDEPARRQRRASTARYTPPAKPQPAPADPAADVTA